MKILDLLGFSRGLQHTTGEHRTLSTFSQLAAGSLLLIMANTASAIGEVEGILTEAVPATPSSYVKDGIQINWGQDNDLILKGFIYQGKTYDELTHPDQIVVQRVDNDNVSGTRCGIYAENTGDPYTMAPSYPDDGTGNCDMAELVAGTVINRGSIDLFTNTQAQSSSHNNIERVDIIFNAGIAVSEDPALLATSGHLVAEKSGNNYVQVAAITALENGKPSAFGPLVLISPSNGDPTQLRYGLLPDSFIYHSFLSNEAHPPQTQASFIYSIGEPLGMVFVSQQALGFTPGDRYFGFSFFAPDVIASLHTLTDPSTFPRDTRRYPDGDADLFGGTGFFAQPVEPENQPPVAKDDTGTTHQNKSLTLDILANDSDPDNDPLTLEITAQPEHGALTVDGDFVTYTPNDGYSGKDSFSYTISDGNGGEDAALVTLSIAAVLTDPGNQAPIAQDDTGVTHHDEPVSINILANDSDPDNDPLSFEITSQPQHGSLTIDGGIVTYIPDDGYSGKDTFGYTLSDGNGGKDNAIVTISIATVKDAPIQERGEIQTGLNGHGAGSMDGLLLLLLSFAVTWRFRRSLS